MRTPSSVTLPAGRYFVGDPIYVFPETNVGRQLLYMANDLVDLDSTEIQHVRTAYYQFWCAVVENGNSIYIGTNGLVHPVDSGVLGIVPYDVVEQLTWSNEIIMFNLTLSGSLIECIEPFTFSVDENGVFAFGSLMIPSQPSD